MSFRIFVLGTALALPAPLAAQLENPQEKIRELADEIAKEMQEIDRLLLQARPDKLGAAAAAAGEASKRIDDLLDQTSKSQGATIVRIDQLIAELEKLRQQGNGT